jgi:hypothetical protein
MAETPEQALAEAIGKVVGRVPGDQEWAGAILAALPEGWSLIGAKPMSTADFPVFVGPQTDRIDAFLNMLPGSLGDDTEIVAALDRLINAERAEAIANQPALSQTQEVERILAEIDTYAQEIREDWSDFDGRSNKNVLNGFTWAIHRALTAEPEGGTDGR